MDLKVGDRIELGTKERPRDGTIIALSATGEVALVEWEEGGFTTLAFDVIHWFDHMQDVSA